MNQTDLGIAVGVTQPSVSAWERDKAVPEPETMVKVAKATGTTPGWLQFGDADQSGARVVGIIGAGAQITPFTDLESAEAELVPKPVGYEQSDVEAYEIRGDSMYPLQEGWLVFVIRNRTVDARMILRRLCVVGLSSDEALLKEVHAGTTKGRYTLHSWNAPARENVALKWANPVIDIRPRGVVSRGAQ